MDSKMSNDASRSPPDNAPELLMQLANDAAATGRKEVARILASTSELLKAALAADRSV